MSTTRPTSTVRRTCALALALACLSVGIGSTAASASGGGSGSGSGGHDDGRVILEGSCKGGGGHWKVKVKPDDGRLEVEYEVDTNVSGQTWRWTLRHNRSVSDRGSATTSGPSGSFSVERMIVDISGTDRVAFRAVYNGQGCRGVVNY